MKKTVQKELKPVLTEDIALYQIPGLLMYSPDGKTLAFQVTRQDLKKNCARTDVYLRRDGETRRMTWDADASPVLWQDENTLLIRKSALDAPKGITQLFALDIRGGEAAPFLTLPFPLLSLKKLDSGAFAAIGMTDKLHPDAWKLSEEKRKALEEELKEEKDYEVLDEVPYWFNGAGFTNGKRKSLFLIGAEPDRRIRKLTGTLFDTGEICADGNRIYYTGCEARTRIPFRRGIYCFDTETGKNETLYPANRVSAGDLFVLRGQLYASVTDMKTYGVNETGVISRVEKGKLTEVYTPEVSLYCSMVGDTAEGGGGSAELKNSRLTLATVDSRSAVFRFTRGQNGRLKKQCVWEKEGMICALDATEEKIALVYQPWNEIAEVWEMNADGTGMTRVTGLNTEALRGRYIAEPRRVEYESEGEKLTGWLLLPLNFDPGKRWPAVLDIHGGPRCVYGETFFHEMQLWASKGYAVFFTNIRGSDGRGDAFADIRGDYGGTDFRNLMDFTDAALAACPAIDPKRVCVTGGSYGGFMTNWIIGHTDRFCCAASQRSISNWVSFSFISDIGGEFGPDQCGAPGLFGKENTEKLWEHSPLKYADRAHTPTLFIHSDEDYRCPLPEGMQMMQALADRGVETRMCLFHGENHELSRSGKPKHRIRRLKEITDWFEKHAK